MMERILQDIPLAEPEELDTLLEVAQTVRELIRERREDDLSALIQYTVRHSYYEALHGRSEFWKNVSEKMLPCRKCSWSWAA